MIGSVEGIIQLLFLNRTHVLWGGSKTKYHRDTCLKEIGLHLQFFIKYSALNNKHKLGGLMYSI